MIHRKFFSAVLVCTCYLTSGLPGQAGSSLRSSSPPKIASSPIIPQVTGANPSSTVFGLGNGTRSSTQVLANTSYKGSSSGLSKPGIIAVSTTGALVSAALITAALAKAGGPTAYSSGSTALDILSAAGRGATNIASGIAGFFSVAEVD